MVTVWTVFKDGQPTDRKDVVTDMFSGYRRATVKQRFFKRNGQDATFKHVSFFDYSEGSMSLYYPLVNKKTTRPLWKQERETWNAVSDCVSPHPGWEIEPKPKLREIQGYRVIKRTSLAYPRSGPDAKPSDTARVFERWVAPELDCYDLQIRVSEVTAGGRRSVMLAVNTTSVEHSVEESLLTAPEVPEVHITDLRRLVFNHFGEPFDTEMASVIAKRFYGTSGAPPVESCKNCKR